MNTLIKIIVLVVLNLTFINATAQSTHDLTVTVKGTENNDGKMFVAVYNDASTFLSKSYKGVKSDISNNSCTVSFKDLPEGTYAVYIFHDENDNGKLDTNFFGIPKEDYGCSNDAKGFMGPPKWKDAIFEFKQNKTITITL